MDRLVRHRAWVVMAAVFVSAILAVALGKGTKNGAVRGGGDIPRVSFGSGVQKAGATSRLIYTNGWTATSGAEAIAVYAGRDRINQRNGLFVILRATAGRRRGATVVVRGSGSVTLLRPTTPDSEQAAFTATLHFVTANGGTGTLNLSGDRVSVSG
jgi:hypothetical protein